MGKIKGIFFAKDSKCAKKRTKDLMEKRELPKGTIVKLAKKQMKHISGWKTFEYK